MTSYFAESVRLHRAPPSLPCTPLLALPIVLLMTGACTRVPATTTPSPAGLLDSIAPAGGRPALPPIPLATGALAPRVQYPGEGALIASRDSNFIFGSVGD